MQRFRSGAGNGNGRREQERAGWDWLLKGVEYAGKISAAVQKMHWRGAMLDVGKPAEKLLDSWGAWGRDGGNYET